MSTNVSCPRCGCAEIDKDAATGGSYCTNCGSVLEENAIVAEVEFFETGTGGHGALGQFVSADAPSKLRMGSMPGVSTKESREVTLQKARRLINEVASQLRLNQHCKDTALNFISMAIRSGFTRGRRSTHVIAACLYITCRLEGTPHLLLDFSDILQVNVFELGRVYTFIARKLMIRLPNVDPCDYVMRFAHALNLGEKEHEVAMVALRLVQRMKRDWIAIGRRPTGLCGAALLLAARYHNFNRSVNDIVQIVNISETVIRKRLDEFASTPSSELTLNEFQTVDLEQTCDPPAYREARSKAKKFQQDVLKRMEKELPATEAAVEAALNTVSESKRQPCSKFAKINVNQGNTIVDGDDGIGESEDVRQFVEEQILYDIIPDDGEASTSRFTNGKHTMDYSTPADKYRALRPTLETLGITKSICDLDTSATSSSVKPDESITMNPDDDSLLTSDLDDDEINSYILNPDEIKMKEELWMNNYEDFVKALEEKRRLKEEERIKEEQEGGPKKKKPANKKKKPTTTLDAPTTAVEAIERIVQEKKLSNKINYDVLKGLIVPDETAASMVSSNASTSSGRMFSDSGTSFNRFKPYAIKKQPQEGPVSSTPTGTTSSPTGTMERRFRIGARIAASAALSANERRSGKTDDHSANVST